MAKTDEIVKRLGQLRPEDFVKWVYPELIFEKISFQDREFVSTQRRVDGLFLVKSKELGEFYFHLEFQAELKAKEDFGLRMLEYATLIWKTLKKPVKTVAIFLETSPKIRELEPLKQCKIGEEVLIDFRYKKIVLPEMKWEEVLKSGFPALFPLIPLSKIPEEESAEAIKKTFKEIEKVKEKGLKEELAMYFYLLGGTKYKEILKQIIGEKLMKDMMESATYREIFEQGEEKGGHKTGKELVMECLKENFEKIPKKIEHQLDQIVDLQDFKRLLREGMKVKNLEKFENILEELIKKQKNKK